MGLKRCAAIALAAFALAGSAGVAAASGFAPAAEAAFRASTKACGAGYVLRT